MSHSLLDSYKASMEEARLEIRHKEKEIEIEKEEYALQSEENLKRAEQRLRYIENRDECMLVTEMKISDGFCDPYLTTEKHKLKSYQIYRPQVAPLHVRGPSHTSTPMVRHTA